MSSPITSTSAARRAATTRSSSRRSWRRTRRPSRRRRRRCPTTKGKTAKVKFSSRLDYHPFRIKDNAPVVLPCRGGRSGYRDDADIADRQRRSRRQLAGARTASRPSPSAPGRTIFTPSTSGSTCPSSIAGAGWRWRSQRSRMKNEVVADRGWAATDLLEVGNDLCMCIIMAGPARPCCRLEHG